MSCWCHRATFFLHLRQKFLFNIMFAFGRVLNIMLNRHSYRSCVNLSAVNKINFYFLCNASHFYLLTSLLTLFFFNSVYIVTEATDALNNKSTKLNINDGMPPAATDVAVMSIMCMAIKPLMPTIKVS